MLAGGARAGLDGAALLGSLRAQGVPVGEVRVRSPGSKPSTSRPCGPGTSARPRPGPPPHRGGDPMIGAAFRVMLLSLCGTGRPW